MNRGIWKALRNLLEQEPGDRRLPGAAGRERKVLNCFSVAAAGEDQGQQTLADRVVQACRQRKVHFTAAAVALDCASFMQHSVHSEFSDPKRIAATVRFDTEEALATDIAEMAVAFRITASGDEGSNLDVFTAQRPVLSEILLSLQSNGIDPLAVDPDVCCLARYLTEYAKAPESPDQSTLYALLSDSRGYLVVVAPARQASVLRTFLIGGSQDRTGLLVRETLVTTALAEAAHPVRRLCVFDTTGGLRPEALAEGTGLNVSTWDPAGLVGVTPAEAADAPNVVDLALACGAALTPAQKTDSVNLRNDHMPYLGKKRRLQNRVRLLSLLVTILLLSVGVYLHSQLLRVNKDRQSLRDKLSEDYLPLMPGRKMPLSLSEAVSDLDKTLRVLRMNKEGPGANQESVAAKLTLVLQGINSCARQTDLNINSIVIGATGISIIGDTSGRQNTVALQDAMKKVGLAVDEQRVGAENNRDTFMIRLKLDSDKKAKGT